MHRYKMLGSEKLHMVSAAANILYKAHPGFIVHLHECAQPQGCKSQKQMYFPQWYPLQLLVTVYSKYLQNYI